MTVPDDARLPAGSRRPDASMSLLVDIATQALDPGYADAAAARGPNGGGPAAGPGRSARVRTAVVAALAAVLFALAAVQASSEAPAVARSRAALLQQVDARTADVNALQDRLQRLRTATTQLQDQALETSRSGAALARRLAGLELAAGAVPVHGPGLRVVLNDAAGSGPDNRVLDSDVQSVVNALWAGGAEAVAVGPERVTTETAIRQAGDSILVNFEPVSAPYVVDAIGDPVALETSFAASPAAARLKTFAQLYGIGFHYSRETSLSLAAAPGLSLRYARPGGGAS